MRTANQQTDQPIAKREQPSGIYVIGCPRSGTGFTSRVLREAGYDVGHESIGSFGTSDFRCVSHRIPDGVAVLHQVRHPLHCMTSLQTILDSSFRWLIRRIAFSGIEFDPQHRVETTARIWLHYNAQCETMADVTYRVESETEWRTACQTLGIPAIDRSKTATDFNTRRGQSKHDPFYECPVTWQTIEAQAGRRVRQMVQRMAARYGYEW